jgi:hypothetical protein
VEALFDVSYSETGSNRYHSELTTMTYWRDLLQDLEGLYAGLQRSFFIFVRNCGSNVLLSRDNVFVSNFYYLSINAIFNGQMDDYVQF